MAKKSKRNRSEQRDVSPIASPSAVRSLVSKPLLSDRRLYHPLQDVAPVYSPAKSHRKIVERPKNVSQPNRNKARTVKRKNAYKMAFGVPGKVDLCVRRHKRREVLFALRRTGKGSRAIRRRRNYYSGVSC